MLAVGIEHRHGQTCGTEALTKTVETSLMNLRRKHRLLRRHAVIGEVEVDYSCGSGHGASGWSGFHETDRRRLRYQISPRNVTPRSLRSVTGVSPNCGKGGGMLRGVLRRMSQTGEAMNIGRKSLSSVLVAAAIVAGSATGALAQDTELKVMSFNIWGGGANENKPIDETVAAIKAAGADIIGIQETRLESDPCTAEVCPATGESRAKAIADALGFHVYDQTAANDALWANAILSRFPIGKATANDTGVEIDVNGRKVYAFNIHLDDSPYQPYQLLGIEYGPFPYLKTAEEAVKAAEATRAAGIALFREDLKAADGADAAFVFGDFNEPSHRDWTEAAVKAGHQPIAVAYPTALAVEGEGFVDAFRAVFPDEVAKPAFTWTPTTEPTDPEDHHDRIDYVFARAPKLEVLSAGIVGEKAPEADIVVTPWPSDHRAVVATVKF